MLSHTTPRPGLPESLLLFLSIVVVVALLGGASAGIATAVVSVPVITWFLTEPVHSFRIEGGEDVAALGVFAFVAIVVSGGVHLVARRTDDAREASERAASLARTAARAEAAEEGDRLRTAILRSVSHDLRTPLASIKASATSLLQDDIDWSDEEQRDFLMTIDEETDRLDRIVGDLLDLSRLDAGVLSPQLIEVDVTSVVRSSAASAPGWAASDDRITITAPPHPVLAGADPVMLERVLANLLANALAHGGGEIDLRVMSSVSEVTISVIDHGSGMSDDELAIAFEPFRRFGDRTVGSGTGLGLAIAKGFTDAMDGRLELRHTPGGGLTADLLLSPSVTAQSGTAR